MKYNTIITSKGTTTIPVEIRKQLGIKPGMYVTFNKDGKTGDYFIKRSQTIKDLRAQNKSALKLAGTQHKQYKSGDGFNEFLAENYVARK